MSGSPEASAYREASEVGISSDGLSHFGVITSWHFRQFHRVLQGFTASGKPQSGLPGGTAPPLGAARLNMAQRLWLFSKLKKQSRRIAMVCHHARRCIFGRWCFFLCVFFFNDAEQWVQNPSWSSFYAVEHMMQMYIIVLLHVYIIVYGVTPYLHHLHHHLHMSPYTVSSSYFVFNFS